MSLAWTFKKIYQPTTKLQTLNLKHYDRTLSYYCVSCNYVRFPQVSPSTSPGTSNIGRISVEYIILQQQIYFTFAKISTIKYLCRALITFYYLPTTVSTQFCSKAHENQAFRQRDIHPSKEYYIGPHDGPMGKNLLHNLYKLI